MISDAGAQAIAGATYLANLTSLDLWNNDIGEAGAQAIAGAAQLANLTSLNRNSSATCNAKMLI